MFVFLDRNLAEVKRSLIPPDFGMDFEQRVKVYRAEGWMGGGMGGGV